MSKFQSQITINTPKQVLTEEELELVTNYANNIVEHMHQPDRIFAIRITDNRLKIKDPKTGQRVYSESLSSVINTAREYLVIEHYLRLLSIRTIYLARTEKLRALGTEQLREYLDSQSPLPADDKELIEQVDLVQDSLSRTSFGDWNYKLHVKVRKNQTEQWAVARVTHVICSVGEIRVCNEPVTDTLLERARATIDELRTRLGAATQQWEDASESDILNRIENEEVSLVSLRDALTWLNLSH